MWFENRIIYNHLIGVKPGLQDAPCEYHIFSPNKKKNGSFKCRKFSKLDKLCLLILLIKENLLFTHQMEFIPAGYNEVQGRYTDDVLQINT